MHYFIISPNLFYFYFISLQVFFISENLGFGFVATKLLLMCGDEKCLNIKYKNVAKDNHPKDGKYEKGNPKYIQT